MITWVLTIALLVTAFRTTPHLGSRTITGTSSQSFSTFLSTPGSGGIDPPDPNGLHLPKVESTPAYTVAGRWWPTLVVPGPGVAHLLSRRA